MTPGLHPDQLSLLLLLEETLAGGLHDRRRMPQGDGPARLLTALVRGGLDREALLPAAALALELDRARREAPSV